MGLILRPFFGIALNGVILYVLTLLVEEITYTGGLKFFIIGGIVVGLLNLLVKPIIKLVSLPLVVITGGFFLVVINAGLLWFLQYFLQVAQFQNVTLSFPNAGSYVIGAIVFGVVNWAFHLISK